MDFTILTDNDLPAKEVREYWVALQEADLLRYRLCGIQDPGWLDVFNMLNAKRSNIYYMVTDVEGIVGEFELESIAGAAFAVHFSFHPTKLTIRQKLRAGRATCNRVLTHWKNDTGGRYAATLIGLLPIVNKAGIRFAEKVGFTNIGVLPSAQQFNGSLTDAQFMLMSTGEYHG